MKTMTVLIAILMVGLLTPTATADTSEPSAETAQCQFITIFPFYPFVIIDPTCPPIGPGTDGF